MANSVFPDQTAPIGAVCSESTLLTSTLDSSLMLGNYLQQPTSDRQHFQMYFFLGALRVKLTRTVSLTGLWKRSLDKRLIYPHILHVTLKTDNCLLGQRRLVIVWTSYWSKF